MNNWLIWVTLIAAFITILSTIYYSGLLIYRAIGKKEILKIKKLYKTKCELKKEIKEFKNKRGNLINYSLNRLDFLSPIDADRLFLESHEITIVGVCLSHVIDFIYDYEPKDRFWGKQIKLIVSGNHQFLNMINKVEGEKRPNLINMNLSRARKIVTSSANLSISMTVYPVSCGISRYDDILFLTPYTHIGGDRSPTYRIDKGENAELFDHYKNYMEKLLEAAVNVTA